MAKVAVSVEHWDDFCVLVLVLVLIGAFKIFEDRQRAEGEFFLLPLHPLRITTYNWHIRA